MIAERRLPTVTVKLECGHVETVSTCGKRKTLCYACRYAKDLAYNKAHKVKWYKPRHRPKSSPLQGYDWFDNPYGKLVFPQ